MKCKKKRTIFDLFEIYNCETCEFNKKDEEIIIGDVKITIIYGESFCPFLEKGIIDKDDCVISSNKVRLFLKDAIISQLQKKEILLVWIEEFKIDEYEELIDTLIDFKMNIFILTNF